MKLDEMRHIAEAATAGKWTWKDHSQLKVERLGETALDDYHGSNAVLSTLGSTPIWAKQPDRSFIATFSPATVKLLLGVVEAAMNSPCRHDASVRGYECTLCNTLMALQAAHDRHTP